MNKTLNFKTFKTFLQLIFLVVGVLGLAQTYPALEFGNVTPSPNTNTSLSFDFQKDTNNNTATNLVNYTSPSVLTVSYNVTATSFPNGLRFGAGGAAPFYTLMNAIGNAGSDNTQYTSFGVPTNGTGIDIASNYAPYISANLASAGTQPGNGRVKLGELTITLSRGNNNPILHFKGLGAASGSSLTAEFNIKSILNSAGAEILSTTNLVQLTGTNLNVNNITKIINNDYTGATDPATTNTARGSVRFQNNDIRTIVLEVYGNRNGTASNVTWTGADDFFISISAGESDLQVTKTVSNATPTEGSNIVFTVTASNLGASNNTNVTVNDLLPTGYTYVSHTASTGTYVPGTGVWTIGNLNDAANATLAITAKVNPTGNFTNSATISTTSGILDPNTSNNSASVSTTPVIVDSDGDGVPNSLDLDDDNDGITDCDENLLGANASVSNVFSFVTAGTAIATSNNEVRLTQNTGNQAGQIWSVGKVDFTKSFVLRFDAYLGTNDNGADGIAAVFHNSPQGVNATGATGSGIGARGIANGIVLELDTYDNGTSLGDISSDHGQIWDSDNQTSTGFLTTAVALPNLENSTWHPVVINWNASTKTISYTVDGTNAGTYTGDLVTNYFAGANKVYFGYTASTGGATNEQKIRINSFCSDLPLELDTDGDDIANSLDLDSDNDGCPDAIEGDENVTASQLTANRISGGVDVNGVPNLVNSGGAADIDGDQGQGAGQAYTVNPAAAGGTASSNQSICTGATPAALSLSGHSGAIQWQSSTDNVTFTNISGATSTTYAPGALTATTYYRAVLTSAGGCTANSSTVTITVNPLPTITGTTAVCVGSTTQLSGSGTPAAS
ncbi:conserved repeat domain protein, partial [Cloacibacterium normanense]